MKISVAVCTRNRCRLLRLALASLCSQTLARNDFEVVVVDNSSSDDTRHVVESFHDRLNLQYVTEPKIGLSYARNAGYLAARSEYVAYLDDDAKAFPDWLKRICSDLESMDIDILGGPYYPFYLTSKPSWFRDIYAQNVSFPSSRFAERGEYCPTGSNVVVRKSVLERVGGFEPTFGMKGNRIAYGEENRMVDAAWSVCGSLRLYYDVNVRVNHLVSRERMRLSWWLRSSLARGRSLQLLELAAGHGNDSLWTTQRELAKRVSVLVCLLWQHVFAISRRSESRDASLFVNVQRLIVRASYAFHALAHSSRQRRQKDAMKRPVAEKGDRRS